jgi:thiamine kinase-like enzyme
MIRVPKLIYSDDEVFVLVLEDAGARVKALTKYLENGPDLIEDEQLLTKIAKNIHAFVRFLQESNNKSSFSINFDNKHLENKESTKGYYEQLKNAIKYSAAIFNLEKELAPYLASYWSTVRPFDDDESDNEANNNDEMLRKVFVFGDLWPNSMLYDSERKLLWIIDWEMARFDTATRDVEQLMSFLWIFKTNEALFSARVVGLLMEKLQFEFFGDERSDWRVKCGRLAKASFVIWVASIVRNPQWVYQDQRDLVLKALSEVQNY